MSNHGALELTRSILLSRGSDLSLMKSVIGLMRNLCADDVRKDKLVADGTLDLLIAKMGDEVYAADAALMEHAFACLAAISLRSPSNAQRILDTGQFLVNDYYFINKFSAFFVIVNHM